jgi:hypothetical protein
MVVPAHMSTCTVIWEFLYHKFLAVFLSLKSTVGIPAHSWADVSLERHLQPFFTERGLEFQSRWVQYWWSNWSPLQLSWGNAPDLDVWVAARSKVRWWWVWKKTIQEYRYMVIRAGGNTLQNSTLDQNFSSNSSNTQPGLGAPVTGQQPTRARTLIITRQPQVVLPIARRISWRKWQLSQQLATPASMSYAAAQQPGGVVPICRHGMFLVALETVKFHSC